MLFIFLLFNVHLIVNLEKIVFINEALSLLGLMAFAGKVINGRPFDKVSFYVFILFCYLFIYSVFSFIFLRDGTVYQFARTLPVFYSVPCFFLGSIFYYKYHRLFFRRKNFFRDLGVAVISISMGGRLSNQVILPFTVHSRDYRLRMLLLSAVIFVFCLVKGGATSWAFFLLSVYLLIDSRVRVLGVIFRPYVFMILFLFLVVGLRLLYDAFEGFYMVGFSFFGEGSDVNSLWRIMYWAYVISERFFSNPIFGIGFGNQLFDPARSATQFIVNATPDDPHLPYVHGPHNSFIYILVRTGILGFAIFSLILTKVLGRCFRVWRSGSSVPVQVITISLLLFLISAFFNVILESPLYSGIFWVLLGVANTASLVACNNLRCHEK